MTIKRGKNNVVYVDTTEEEMVVIAEIVERKQHATIKQHGAKKGVLVDLYSASAIMNVYNHLSPESQAKMRSVPIGLRADIAFRVLAHQR